MLTLVFLQIQLDKTKVYSYNLISNCNDVDLLFEYFYSNPSIDSTFCILFHLDRLYV